MDMFCYQCEQASKETGCNVVGVCGKSPEVSALVDLTMHAATGLAVVGHRARMRGIRDRAADVLLMEALFLTVTNVNFDTADYVALLPKLADARDRLKNALAGVGDKLVGVNGATRWAPARDLAGLVQQGSDVGLRTRMTRFGDDVVGLQELVVYGLKGLAAYAHHAQVLGKTNDEIYGFLHQCLSEATEGKLTAEGLTALALKVGAMNLMVMELLDGANTSTYGHPVPTPVRIDPVKGKAILVSGHDLKDLEALLEQTAGTGINVYTHGEMLPAHGYPELKKHKHLVGNYGGAWQDQLQEFEEFPGAVLMTTNCIQRPAESYKARIFTCGLVGWPGVTHIGDRDFRRVIESALAAPGFAADGPGKTILVGFGHNAVLGVADKVIGAVKAGKIRRFYLIGGCDGAKSGRNYYTHLAERLPQDTVIMTLACGKYRFNTHDFGTIDGIPRLLDIGQCNDAYSAIKIATALADAFKCGVNDLPLSMVLSWYEQKAVAILLTLLHLGIKNIRLGPSLPAFVTAPVLKVLVDNFNLMPIKTVEEDIRATLGS